MNYQTNCNCIPVIATTIQIDHFIIDFQSFSYYFGNYS